MCLLRDRFLRSSEFAIPRACGRIFNLILRITELKIPEQGFRISNPEEQDGFRVLLFLQRLSFKLNAFPGELHKVADVLVVGSLRILQHIDAVIVPEEGEGLGLVQTLKFGEGENLAAAVVLSGFVDRGTVGEAGRGEVVVGVNVGDDFWEVDGLRGLVDFFG